jgi:hypothetical protein
MASNYSLIVPYLYIGGKDAMNQDIKFDTIINCTPNLPFPSYCKNCIRVPVNNNTNNCGKFFDIITKTNVLEQIHSNIQNKKQFLFIVWEECTGLAH